MDVKKSVLADILNECLQVAKGMRFCGSQKVSKGGVLSGDEADYAIISMPKLFMVASAYISGDRNGEFIYGYTEPQYGTDHLEDCRSKDDESLCRSDGGTWEKTF